MRAPRKNGLDGRGILRAEPLSRGGSTSITGAVRIFVRIGYHTNSSKGVPGAPD